MRPISTIFMAVCAAIVLGACKPSGSTGSSTGGTPVLLETPVVRVGAERTAMYMPMLRGKRVGLYSNHTGILPDGRHTLDLLLDSAIDVRCVFSPEHGFRGTADAGEHVSSSIDPATGIPIVSLYGPGYQNAMAAALDSIDVVVTDIQDVGLRYYTYYVTMLKLINEAAERHQKFIVMDRPNPNGMYVDGPILDMKLKSGVGALPIPVVHGLTLGELALMANGEGWLNDGQKADIAVIPCEGYSHSTRYELPIAPSPNLPNMTSIHLYPSLCYFEGTSASLGRGTDLPFQIYGHPKMKGRHYEFTPESRPGAKNPPQKGVKCYGENLSSLDHEQIIANGLNLEYVIDAYRDVADPEFFTPFFDKLIGRSDIRQMIISGKSADEIRATWGADVARFQAQRQPYLLYP